jgi:NitT/TauT family transport system permease protein
VSRRAAVLGGHVGERDDSTSVTAPPIVAAAAPARRGAGKSLALTFVPPFVVLGSCVGAWYFITYVVLAPKRRFLLPPPQDVIRVGFMDGEHRAELLEALWNTGKVALTGLLIAMVLGFAVAIVMSQARAAENGIYPFAVVLQTIPMLALVPIVGFWFGFNFRSRVLVCVIISLFPIITNTLFGLKSAERGLHDLFTLCRTGRRVRLFKLQFPAALPAVFTGLRISAGLSVIGAIVGDYFFRQGEPGIGRLLDNFSKNLQSEQLFAAVALSSMLGLAVFCVFGWLAKRMTGHWYEPNGPSGT